MTSCSLCTALTHVYGHNQWWNPVRPHQAGSLDQSPYEAYQDLKPEYQKIVTSLFGREPEKHDGLDDDDAPVEFRDIHRK